jgi:hypothetical protein
MTEPTVHGRFARIVPSRDPDDLLEWCDPDEVRDALNERDDRITELERHLRHACVEVYRFNDSQTDEVVKEWKAVIGGEE